jgi:hypothetical protein
MIPNGVLKTKEFKSRYLPPLFSYEVATNPCSASRFLAWFSL